MVPDGPAKLTRAGLFEMAWAEPLSKLARRFGMSDVGLKKHFVLHDIPTPPRGYWARLASGQKPRVPRLGGDPATAVVIPSQRAGARSLEEFKELVARAPEKRERLSSSVLDSTVSAIGRRDGSPPDRVVKLSTKRAIEGAFVARDAGRLTALLGSLDWCLEQLGWTVEKDEDATYVVVGDERVGLTFFSEPIEPDAGEGPQPQRTIVQLIANTWGGSRKSFRSNKRRQFDELLPDILKGIEGHAEELRERKERQRQLEEKWKREQQARAEAAAARALSAKREEFTSGVIERGAKLQRLQALRASLATEASAEDFPRLERYLEWLDAECMELQASLTANALDAEIQTRELGF